MDLRSTESCSKIIYGAYDFATNVQEPNKFCKNLAYKELVQLRDPKNDFIFNFNFIDKMKNL